MRDVDDATRLPNRTEQAAAAARADQNRMAEMNFKRASRFYRKFLPPGNKEKTIPVRSRFRFSSVRLPVLKRVFMFSCSTVPLLDNVQSNALPVRTFGAGGSAAGSAPPVGPPEGSRVILFDTSSKSPLLAAKLSEHTATASRAEGGKRVLLHWHQLVRRPPPSAQTYADLVAESDQRIEERVRTFREYVRIGIRTVHVLICVQYIYSYLRDGFRLIDDY